MGEITVVLFAFLAGLTLCGIAASLFELRARQEVRFAAPFVSSAHPARSVAATLLAGPFMLGNDALAARRTKAISRAALTACAAAAALWLLAAGTVVLAFASSLAGLVV